MGKDLLVLLLAVVLIACLIAWPFIWLRRRQIRLFALKWAQENGLKLVAYEPLNLVPLSFSAFEQALKRSRTQEIILAEVMDSFGNKRRCWLTLGGYYAGLLRYEVQCKWVD